MPLANVDVLHGIVNSSTFISQFTSQEVSPGMESLLATSAGQIYPQFAATMGLRPEIRFTTPQVKTILDLVDDDGIADLSGANTDLYFKATADQSNRVADATTSHHRWRAAQVLLVLERITAGHRTEAQAQCRLICAYDGTNVPLVYAGSVALSGTPTSAEHYVLGECHINGSEVDGVQDLDLDWGQNIFQGGGSGELYDTFNCQMQSTPTVMMNALNSGFWSTSGLAFDISSGSFYLRKLARAGRVADATAEHIKFTVADGLGYVDRSSGDGMSPNVTSIRLQPIAADATTAALVVSSTVVAITN
jgi:hypothetical protein